MLENPEDAYNTQLRIDAEEKLERWQKLHGETWKKLSSETKAEYMAKMVVVYEENPELGVPSDYS